MMPAQEAHGTFLSTLFRSSLAESDKIMASDESVVKQALPGFTRRSWIGISVVAIGILLSGVAMGRVWWCEAGDLWPWTWDVWSRHCSQHLLDPYSLSHLQHGIGLYLLLTLFCGRRLMTDWRVLLVACVEAGWEIVENTNWMIQRYRTATIALDYFGDSILNSLGDYTACMIGVWLAIRLPWRVSVGLFVALEVISVCWIRDSLLLNILMLLYSVDAIRQWQLAT